MRKYELNMHFTNGKCLAQGGKDLEHKGGERGGGAECKWELFSERCNFSFLLHIKLMGIAPQYNRNGNMLNILYN